MENQLSGFPSGEDEYDPELLALLQQTYRPALALERATRRNSYARLDVVQATNPHQICGQARRIGYLSNTTNALALYRLKIRCNLRSLHLYGQVTLPGWFVLENGIFSPAPP